MDHVCTERNRIIRIEKFIDGNGREGLNDRVSKMSEKLDTIEVSVSGLKGLLRWTLTIILSLIAIGISVIALI
jgi:hypothetical protein